MKSFTPNEVMVDLIHAGGRPWADFANSLSITEQGLPDPLSEMGAELLGLGFPIDQRHVPALRILRGQFREAVRELASQHALRPETVDWLNEVMAAQSLHWQLTDRGLQEQRALGTAEQLVGRLAEGLAAYAAAGSLERLRKCSNPSCQMHFVDDTKNGKRRWCSMAVCGSQEKAAKLRSAYAAKKKA